LLQRKTQKGGVMRKLTSILTFSAFLLILFNGSVFCQQVNLAGTWIGETTVPDEIEPDKVTLVLERIDGEYTGKVTDAFGYAMDSELQDVKFEDDKLTANFFIFNGEEYVKITFTLTVEGDTMTGEWMSDDGNSAPIKLERKK
jgi:hypothetical protein